MVSVIVPTRDRPTLVAGAVRSALNQEDVRVEVCVVDDGSSPPVALPRDLAAEVRVSMIRFETPRGAGAARNAGLAATTGELVAFLDDDDVWLTEKLIRQLGVLRARRSETPMVVCGFEAWKGTRLIASRLPPAEINSGALLAHPCAAPSAVLARRSAVERAGGFDEHLARVEDWDLWLRLADLGEIATIPEVLVDRRWQTLPPSAMREARASIAPRLAVRRDQLPHRVAAPLRARWWFDDALVLASLGHRRQATTLLLAAWRDHPRSGRVALGLARILAGERVWTLANRVAAPLRDRLRRRGPRPEGPAPVWAVP